MVNRDSHCQAGVSRRPGVRSRFSVASASSSRPDSGPLPSAVVGRDNELGEVAAVVAAGGPGVAILAPAGVGKSRLAREAVRRASEAGALTVWIQATRSAAAVALGACAALVPEDARADDPLDVMRRTASALQERAAGRRVLLAVDDAQLLDAVSAALVLHLVVTGTVTVVATVRTGEPCPDAIVSLWKDAGAARMHLRELDAAGTGALVEAMVGGAVEEDARRWIFETSRGNALYVRELVGAALDRGTLLEVAGLWRMADRPPVSSTLAELVASRLVGLGDDERRVLELLAIGEPLRADELAGEVGDRALLAAEDDGLVTVGEADDVRMAHPLYGEVIAADLPRLHGRELRRRLIAIVERRDARAPGDVMRIARWRLDSGDELSADLLLESAEAALAAGDPELAERVAQRAVDSGAGARAAFLLGRAHIRRSRFDEAETVLASVEDDLPDEELGIAYLQRRVGLLYWNLHRGDDAVALLDRAATWWPGERWRQRMAALQIYPLLVRGGLGGSADEMGELLADPQLDPAARRQLEPMHVGLLFYSGRAREAQAIAQAAEPVPPLSGLDEQAMFSLASASSIDGGFAWEAVRARREAAFAIAVRAQDHAAAGLAASWLGHAHLLAGRLDDARRWLAESEWHFERQDTLGQLVITRALLVQALADRDDASAAAAMLTRAHQALGATDPLPVQRPYLDLAHARLALAEHDAPRAQQLLVASAQAHATMPLQAAWLWHEALRAGASPNAVLAPLEAAAEHCDAPMVDAFLAHVQARDGAALTAAADAFEQIGALVFARETALQAAGAYAGEGRQDSARRAAGRARDLFELGQGGTLPAVEGLDESAVTLTAREAQLVAMAREGLTNPEIADRLVLSVRTVESHLYRAMGKLGVSDRRDL